MNILIISTGDGFVPAIMRSLTTLKMKVHIAGMGKFSRFMLSSHCSGYVVFELQDILCANDVIVDKINNYCEKQKIDVIIPAGIDSTFFISKISKKITTAKVFPISDFEILKMLNNKWTFTEFMVKNGISCPRTTLISDVRQFEQLNLEFEKLDIGFPVIIKALELEDGKGVSKLNSSEELEAYISKENEFNKLPLLIQEYIPGSDVGVSVLAKDGKMIAWTAQERQKDRGVTNIIKDDNMINICEKIVSSCNYSGVAHIDMRIDNRDNSIKVIEFNPRFWGSLEASVLSGVNFPYLGVLVAQNKKLPDNVDYKDIRCLMPMALANKVLRNMSLEDINKHNLYFLKKIVSDPLLSSYLTVYTLADSTKKIIDTTLGCCHNNRR